MTLVALSTSMSAEAAGATATLEYLRAYGIDNLVDAWAVDIYPRGNAPGDPIAAADRRARLAKCVLDECRPAGSEPC